MTFSATGASASTVSESDSPGRTTRTVAVRRRLTRCSVWLMPAERNSLSNDACTAPAGVKCSVMRGPVPASSGMPESVPSGMETPCSPSAAMRACAALAQSAESVLSLALLACSR